MGRGEGAERDGTCILSGRLPDVVARSLARGGQEKEVGRAVLALGGEPCWSTREEQQPCGISGRVMLGELRAAAGTASALSRGG